MGDKLLDAHAKLRRGEFDDKLRDLVIADREAWRTLEKEDERLKANYVVAEVFDYFGQYDHARECLKDAALDQPGALARHTRSAVGMSRNLFKRRIWLAIAHAMTLYRSDDFEGCIQALDVCQAAVDDVDPRIDEYFGTRARLAHTRARADRHLHNHDDARRGFNEAMVFARKRFVRKTRWAEQSDLSSPPFGTTPEQREMFEHQRLLCHWTIGRCLAPGLGFVDYTTGRLSSADTLLSAGYSLLRGTGDVIQRAYATLLMGAVGRARAGNDLDELRKAIDLLEDGANVLRQHPMLTLRASYELALAYYKIPGSRGRAREQIDIIKRHVARSGGDGRANGKVPEERAKADARWMSSTLVVESRLERLELRAAEARLRAEEAVRWAKAARDKHGEILAEALIALGETYVNEADALERATRHDRAREARREAVSHFGSALALSANNPKLAAVCHLHLALTHIGQGALFEAHQEREAASRYLNVVEHGFVKALASSVNRALATSGVFVIDVRGGSLRKADRTSQTEAFLIMQALARCGSVGDAAKLLDMNPDGLSRAIKRLKKGRYLPADFGNPRRPPPGRRPSSPRRR